MRLFVDNLTNVDFSYLCPERGLVGETWLAHIELEGELDHQGMVCDFGIVKKHMRQWLDDTLDHKLLVPSAHKAIECGNKSGQTHVTMGEIAVSSPAEAIALIPVDAITPEQVANWCLGELKGAFGAGVQQMHLRFTTELIDGPFYHYSHGLKKHNGNCQRIAHGHRSKIMIWKNGNLCEQSMQRWAERWCDIYIATEEDKVGETDTTVSFAYQAPQGEFQLTLPKNRCSFMATDTTVELIAQHIAQALAVQEPGNTFTVRAFEGIAKGAVVSASR